MTGIVLVCLLETWPKSVNIAFQLIRGRRRTDFGYASHLISLSSKPTGRSFRPTVNLIGQEYRKCVDMGEGKKLVFNADEILQIFDGNKEMVRELIILFIEMFPIHYNNMLTAIQLGDGSKLASAAQTFEASAANIRAETCRSVALDLELSGKMRDLKQSARAMEKLHLEFHRFKEVALKQYLQ